MTMINVDTVKLRDCGKDVLVASDKYSANIRDLYERMYNVPSKTREWVGVGATNYANNIYKERVQYLNYGNSLKKMGQAMIDYADDIEKAVSKTKIGG